MPPKSKLSRVFNRLVTASSRNKKHQDRENEDEADSPSPPPRRVGRYTLPTPEPSSEDSGGHFAGSSSRAMNDSEDERDEDEEAREDEEEEEIDWDEKDRRRDDRIRPLDEGLIPSYIDHIAFSYLRGFCMHKNHYLKLWVQPDDHETDRRQRSRKFGNIHVGEH